MTTKLSKVPLICTRKDGSEIFEFENIQVAAEKTGINRKSIRDAVSGAQKEAGGFLWKSKEEYDIVFKGYSRKIIQLSDDGTVIGKYNSIISAARALHINSKSIRLVATGKQKHAGGFLWQYENNPPDQESL